MDVGNRIETSRMKAIYTHMTLGEKTEIQPEEYKTIRYPQRQIIQITKSLSLCKELLLNGSNVLKKVHTKVKILMLEAYAIFCNLPIFGDMKIMFNFRRLSVVNISFRIQLRVSYSINL
jgi:hypothetical protein